MSPVEQESGIGAASPSTHRLSTSTCRVGYTNPADPHLHTHTHTHIFIILYIIMCYILYSYIFYNISNQDVCAWYQRPTSAVDTPLNRVLGQVFIQELITWYELEERACDLLPHPQLAAQTRANFS